MDRVNDAPPAAGRTESLTLRETATLLAGLCLVRDAPTLPDTVRADIGDEPVLDDAGIERLITDVASGRVVLQRLTPEALDRRRV
jgi:hypothetical protein